MIDLGTVKPGATIRIPFSSFDKDDGSSITMTNYAAADILIYKDGSTTERASTAGFTATTDFDGKTGKHLCVIDLADNTTADFFTAGSEYLVAIDAVTVDGVTTGGWIARFRIGYVGAILDTFIATLAGQTSFTLNAGPAEDDALNGCVCIIHDAASGVQIAFGYVDDYTGSTKTVTLAENPGIFTMAAKDSISFFPRTSLYGWRGTALPAPDTAGYPKVTVKDGTGAGEIALTSGKVDGVALVDALTTNNDKAGYGLADGAITAAKIAADAITAAKIADGAIDAGAIAADAITAAKIADGAIDAATFAAGAITSAAIAADAIGASELAADAVTEIQSGLATSSALATAQTSLDTIEDYVDTVEGSIGRLLGLSQDNWVIDDTTYDGDGNLTDATIYVYSSKANAQTHDGSTGLLYKYTVEGTFTGANLTLGKQLRET